MAEERILIRHYSNECRYMRVVSCDILKEEGLSNGTYCSAYIHGPWQRIDPEKDCKDCKRAEYEGLSRPEAIERMTKAMSAPYFNDVHASEPDMLEKMAEVALDALIGLP